MRESEKTVVGKTKFPAIPLSHTKTRKVNFWGQEYTVTPAVVDQRLGDGKTLLWFQPLNTRPNYYLICVGSDWDSDSIDIVIDAIIDQYSEIEREREYLKEDLAAQGIKPDASNTDLDGNEDRLGWPVVSLDSGYAWGLVAHGTRRTPGPADV